MTRSRGLRRRCIALSLNSADDFRGKAKSIVVEWAPQLAGRSFHVRFHRRGAAYDLPTPDVERLLDHALLETLRRAASPGAISFSDPDAVIAIDTIDDRAGMGLWRRVEFLTPPFAAALLALATGSTPTARLNPHLIRLPRFDHDR